MHRSGTSATARLLHTSGVDMGGRLLPANAANRLGYYEDAALVELNRRLLAAAVPDRPDVKPAWPWLFPDALEPALLKPYRGELRDLLDERAGRGRAWGFKDPRTTILLDFYDSLLPEARYLFVYRSPWDVVDSLVRLGQRPFAGRVEVAIRAWQLYNEAILSFVARARDRAALVHVRAVARAPERVLSLADALLDSAGAPPREASRTAPFDDSLFTSRPRTDTIAELLVTARPETEELYGRLEAAADIPASAASGRPRERPADVRVRPGSGRRACDVVSVGLEDPHADDALRVAVVPAGDSPLGAASAAIEALGGSRAPVVVLLGAVVRSGALELVARTLADDDLTLPSALLLGACPPGADGHIKLEALHPRQLLEGPDAFAGIAFRREAWASAEGLDEPLPPGAPVAWGLAVALAARDWSVGVVRDAVEGSAPAQEEQSRQEESREGRRRVLVRHSAFAATVLGDDAGVTAEWIQRLEAERDDLILQRDAAMRQLQTTTEERDRARADFESLRAKPVL
jgi:hypothetical protein